MKSPTNPTVSKNGFSSSVKTLALSAALLASAAASFGQAFYTNNASGSFNVGASWNPNGVPTGNASNDNGSNNVVLIQAGDPVWGHGDTLAGQTDGSSGAYLQTGSTNNTGGGNWLRMGIGLNTFGKYVLSNGVVNVGGRIQIGEKGAGYLEISGGSMRANVNDGGANPALGVGDGHFAIVNNNFPEGTVVMNSGTLTIGQESWFGNGDNGNNSRGNGHLIMRGGTLTANNWFVFGRFGGQGDGLMSGGVINKNNNGNVQLGVGTMNGGATPGEAYFNQTGGTFNCGSQYHVGTDSSITRATNDLSGTAVLIIDNWLAVGRSGAKGVMNISGNAAITKTAVNGGNVTIGTGSAGVGTINQNGGFFTNTATSTYIGEDGTGVWNMNSGVATMGIVQLANGSGGNGTLNLNGGTFRVTRLYSPSPLAITTVNLNGGTLQAGADNVNFFNSVTFANVQAGGAVIDSQGFNVTIGQALSDSGGGGLTKQGSGALTLSGANNYTGATTINGGTVATTTASTGGGDYTLANGTTLGLTVLSSGAQLNVANATLASSTAATLNFDLGSFGNPGPSSAPINVSANLAVNGAITVNIADSVPQLGQFPLIKYSTKTGGGSFVLGSLPIGVVASLSNNVGSSSIDLVISGVNQPRWDGQAGGTWDTGSDTNWINIGTGLPTTYSDPSPVVLDDNAQGTTTINLTTTVNPSIVTINNTSKTYAIGGAGKISGSTGITKTGDGALSITNTGGNNYTGKTIVAGGTLTVTSLANGGSPSAIGASSASPTNLVLSAGTLVYSGAPVSINRGYSLGGVNTNSSIDTEGNLTLSGLVTADTGDGFVKTGPAQLAYTTVGSNNLSSADYEVHAGSVRFDGTSGGQTNTVAGRLGVNNAVGASVTLTNTTVSSGGDFSLGNEPGMFGSATINNGTTLNVGSWLLLGDGAGSVADLTMNGGTLNVPNGRFFLCSAPGTTATFTMNGGTINKSGNYFAIVNGGWNAPGARTGTVNQVNGTINCQSECWIGDGGNPDHDSLGVYNLSGGTLTVASWFGIGRDGAMGIFNLSGGAILNKGGGGDMVIGRGGSTGNFIMTGGTLNKDAGNPIIIGQGGGHAVFNHSAGTINCGSEYWVGVDNTTTEATNNISGTAVVNIDNWVSLGRAGQATVNFSGGTFNKTGGGNFIVGDSGTATFNQTGGALNVNSEVWISQWHDGNGTFNMSAGTFTNNSWFAVGREGGDGVLNLSGGVIVKQGGGNISLTHGHDGNSASSVINQSGGLFICASGETWVGEDTGPSTWNMNGGTNVLGYVQLARNSSATGTVNLNGGRFAATEITTGSSGTSTLNLNGGTLVAATGANLNFVHGLTAANVQTGGAVIDTAANDVAFNQALLGVVGDGGLVKNGLGTLQLNGVNTYTNLTQVNAGALGGTGTIPGSVNVASSARLSPGTTTFGTLTVNGSLSLASGSSTFAKVSISGGVTNNDAVIGLANVSYNGALIVSNAGPALTAGGQFKLFTSAASSGNFSSVTVLPSGSGTFNPATGILTIAAPFQINPPYTSGGNLILTGTGGTAGSPYSILTSTNVAAPISSWTTNTTGVFGAGGSFSNALPINLNERSRFYTVKTP